MEISRWKKELAAFVACYVYIGVSITLGLLGWSPVGPFVNVLNWILVALVLATMLRLLVFMFVRVYRSTYTSGTKVLWYVVFFLTNFFGATAFFVYDSFRRIEPKESEIDAQSFDRPT